MDVTWVDTADAARLAQGSGLYFLEFLESFVGQGRQLIVIKVVRDEEVFELGHFFYEFLFFCDINFVFDLDLRLFEHLGGIVLEGVGESWNGVGH